MARLPALSGKDVVKALNKIGYYEVRQRGSHIRFHCRGRLPLTVPNYKTIGMGLLRRILREAKLSAEEFTELLN